jgi:hypothetical protein
LSWLSSNTNADALRLLELNPDKINLSWLSSNTNADALRLLEQNPDKINWFHLSGNPNALRLLEQNPDKIEWKHLSANPNALHLLARLDYGEMKRTFQPLAEELVETVFHPIRVSRIADVYGMDLNEYLEFL